MTPDPRSAADLAPRRERAARLSAIVELIDRHGHRSVRDLARDLRVSEVTIRKDLATLKLTRRVVRMRGGAWSAGLALQEQEFDVRMRQSRAEKQAIGALAATLIEDGDVIALDSSTTALFVARAISARGPWTSLTVVTNGLRGAMELATARGVETQIPAGWVRAEALSVTALSGLATDAPPMRFGKAFLGAAGFTVERGLTEWTVHEAAVKEAMVGAAAAVVAVVDHTKWGKTAPASFCATRRIHVLVTDAGAPPQLLGSLKAQRIDVRFASLRGDA